MRKAIIFSGIAAFMLSSMSAAQASGIFDGAGDNETGDHGYYYAMTGGKDPDGAGVGIGTDGINGDNASGGTFRYITDDPYWGSTVDTWHRDDWFDTNMSLAMTFQNGGSTVYDNNGIEDGSYGDFYNATAQGLASASTPGLYRGFAMSNNYDWIYAGEFILFEEMTIDTLIGYFDANSGLNPADPALQYRMNIWSSTGPTGGPNGYDPVNTGSFLGDVFSSDSVSGTFSWSDTGVDRVFGTEAPYFSMTDDILRLTYALDTPITLQAGVYFFSHDAIITAVPEPTSVALLGIGLAGLVAARRKRKHIA